MSIDYFPFTRLLDTIVLLVLIKTIRPDEAILSSGNDLLTVFIKDDTIVTHRSETL